MSQAASIGIDIGGTKIAFALINAEGGVLEAANLPTQPEQGAASVMDRIALKIADFLDQAVNDVQGIGIGCPGHVDPLTGVVRNAVNLGWAEVNLSTGIQERLNTDLPIWIHKDVNAAALGEKYYGAAHNCSDYIYLAVGTGLGGGAVVNDALVIGPNAYAMEVGHMALAPDGRQCACGLRGCPEMYVSGIGLLAGVKEHAPQFPDSILNQPSELTSAHILEAVHQGDALARHVLEEATEWFVKVMTYCAALFNPALFVIGGGLGHAARTYFIDQAMERLQHRILPPSYEKLRVIESQVQHSAIGAASLVWYAQDNRKHS